MTDSARRGPLARLVDVRPHEVAGMLLSFVYFFCVLTSYYMLRPLRDAMAVAGGVKALPWLFSATFVATLVVVPLWSMLVSRVPRRTLLPIVYRFFIANLLIFYLLFRADAAGLATARAFFIWQSVFNVLAVAVFWAFMADLFRHDQGKRLFGFISAGGSVGAMVGPFVTSLLVEKIGVHNLVLVSAVLLEGAAQCVRLLLRWHARAKAIEAPDSVVRTDEPVGGGGVLSGFRVVFSSPYLLGIAAFVALTTVCATFGYALQVELVAATGMSGAARTALFARLDLAANALIALLQIAVIGRVMVKVGVLPPLVALPPVFALGFLALAAAPTLAVSNLAYIARRAFGYGVAGPASKVLFTVVDREQKYKATAFIDTVVFRGGDMLGSWAFAALAAAGLGLASRALTAVPLAVVWTVVAIFVGRRHAAGAAARGGG